MDLQLAVGCGGEVEVYIYTLQDFAEICAQIRSRLTLSNRRSGSAASPRARRLFQSERNVSSKKRETGGYHGCA